MDSQVPLIFDCLLSIGYKQQHEFAHHQLKQTHIFTLLLFDVAEKIADLPKVAIQYARNLFQVQFSNFLLTISRSRKNPRS